MLLEIVLPMKLVAVEQTLDRNIGTQALVHCRAACESVAVGDLTTGYGRCSTSTCPSEWARLADRAPLVVY
jgi:hypothetical protein